MYFHIKIKESWSSQSKPTRKPQYGGVGMGGSAFQLESDFGVDFQGGLSFAAPRAGAMSLMMAAARAGFLI
jgi:hypothetical protein